VHPEVRDETLDEAVDERELLVDVPFNRLIHAQVDHALSRNDFTVFGGGHLHCDTLDDIGVYFQSSFSNLVEFLGFVEVHAFNFEVVAACPQFEDV
jgi:hypothetical protein